MNNAGSGCSRRWVSTGLAGLSATCAVSSPSRTRTYNLPVNSRPLLPLSYRGSTEQWNYIRPVAVGIKGTFRGPNRQAFVGERLRIDRKSLAAGILLDLSQSQARIAAAEPE
jgi:hypothetical protein